MGDVTSVTRMCVNQHIKMYVHQVILIIDLISIFILLTPSTHFEKINFLRSFWKKIACKPNVA